MSAISDAIVNGNKQIVFMKMDGDVCFDNTDISVNAGITIHDYFCAEENLKIGLCPSNTLTTKILNPNSTITRTMFTPFVLKFGVYSSSAQRTDNDYLSVTVCEHTLTISNTSPYMTYNGVAVADVEPIVNVFAYDTEVYAIYSDGEATKYNVVNGALVIDTDYTTSAYAKGKWALWEGKAVVVGDNCDIQYANGTTTETYLLSNIGVFNPEIPKKVNVKVVELTAYDNMKLLDKDATAFWVGLTFPLTLKQIFTALCTNLGLTASTDSFPNDSVSYATTPAAMEGMTYRELLQHIAEAGCSIAKCQSDGSIKLCWFTNATNPFSYHYSQDVTEVEVQPIDKVQAKNSEDDIGTIVGSGTNCYTILNNMFIVGTVAQMTAMVTAIYNRLSAFSAYYPSVNTIDGDWEIKAGNIITINGLSVPVFTQAFVWNIKGKATIEATGEEVQSVNNLTNRVLYQLGAKVTEVKVDVDGIETTISGLDEAQQATKLLFNSDGLTIMNGGFKIKNSSNVDVFYADVNGNLTMTGAFKTEKHISGTIGKFWVETKGESVSLHFLPNGSDEQLLGVLGITDTNQTSALQTQSVIVANPSDIADPFVDFNKAVAILGRDAVYCGKLGLYNPSRQALVTAGTISSNPDNGVIDVCKNGSKRARMQAGDAGFIGIYNGAGQIAAFTANSYYDGYMKINKWDGNTIVRATANSNRTGGEVRVFDNINNTSAILQHTDQGGSVNLCAGGLTYACLSVTGGHGQLDMSNGIVTNSIFVYPGDNSIKYRSNATHDFINANGTAYANIWCGTVYQNSDRKAKKDFKDIGAEQALTFINGLKPQTFRFNFEDKGKHWGFVAQDIKELVEEMGEEFSGYEEKQMGEDTTCSLTYSELIAPLVKVVQDQQRRIEELEMKI